MMRDTLVLAERNLVRLPRNPDLLLAFTVQPIMFVLLFAYVFGGAIQTPGYDNYIDFLIPGMIVQQICFGGFTTALGLVASRSGTGGNELLLTRPLGLARPLDALAFAHGWDVQDTDSPSQVRLRPARP